MKFDSLIKTVARIEGKKKQVDIAQISEVTAVVLDYLACVNVFRVNAVNVFLQNRYKKIAKGRVSEIYGR